MNFDGIYTPVITPLAADGSIDQAGFAEVLEYLIDAKVHGIIVAATTGEYYAHTAQERYDLAKFAKDVIGTRVALMLGTGAIRTEDSVEYAKVAKAIKADSILVTTPPYALPTEQETAVHALTIDQAADLPVMFYNYPARMGVSMGKEFFDTVFAQSKNFVGLKESSGDMNQLHMLARHYPNLNISCGWDDQALEFFAWGARSWVCAGSNFVPREHIALYEACVLEKDFDKGRRIMAAMMPLMDYLETGHFIQCIKYGCELNGLRTGSVRAPLQALPEDKKQAFAEIVQQLKQDVAAITGGA
ncbi:dihydrodipicolinate synthase family protein [Acinetobacter sp. ME22]|uniref:dihydrodipicolinate synthase family protein n=1 Tax=Acinetobacter sp. ME22 TaxID=2904802 RepID=UPI001EDB43A5|nr:dihydrodipicolinate synthase family protein [Acinetobacter sp. ME22]MCG2572776.1 dihydrodipicolinate synthase family protein [Acinetobacter sp. ME22]